MAIKEHVELLEQGVMAWNKWRAENPEIVPDLSNADLTQRQLGGINLRSALLGGAKLDYAVVNLNTDLSHADLSNASLFLADLHSSTLEEAILRGADLRRANLYDSNLTRADILDANLSEADMICSNVTGVDLMKAKVSGTRLDHASGLSDQVITKLMQLGAEFSGEPTEWALRSQR